MGWGGGGFETEVGARRRVSRALAVAEAALHICQGWRLGLRTKWLVRKSYFTNGHTCAVSQKQ